MQPLPIPRFCHVPFRFSRREPQKSVVSAAGFVKDRYA